MSAARSLPPGADELRTSSLARALAAFVALPWPVRALLPLSIVAVSWWASSREPVPQPPDPVRGFLHNGAHVVLFAGLAGALALTLARRRGPQVERLRPAVAFGLAALYGIVDEWHQSHVPGRTCSVVDVLSDVLGAALGLMLLQRCLFRCGSGIAAHAIVGLAALGSVALATFGPW